MKRVMERLGLFGGTKSCPVRAPRQRQPSVVWPLVLFAVPTVVMGYGVVIPRSCIAGINALTIGFGATVVGACVTYVLGVRSALRR
jgi:hypothetical protein